MQSQRVRHSWGHMRVPPGPGKESACNVGNLGSVPGLGRSSGRGNGNPLQCSCLPHGQRSPVGCSPCNHRVRHSWAHMRVPPGPGKCDWAADPCRTIPSPAVIPPAVKRKDQGRLVNCLHPQVTTRNLVFWCSFHQAMFTLSRCYTPLRPAYYRLF